VLSWADFATQAPDLADEGRRLFASGRGPALLATVRGDAAPRLAAIEIGFVDRRLYAFVFGSKRRDLEQDGRYALHAFLDPAHPDEFLIRGRVRIVDDRAEREPIVAAWAFPPDDRYLLVEFLVETALLGRRATRDDWPPAYTTWSAGPEAGDGVTPPATPGPRSS